ncbi:MAG: hypothetical protein JO337_09100 [Acidimicrobiales bacterium]|nr:hypothetical protein [Acidimicrobiales bacterium]
MSEAAAIMIASSSAVVLSNLAYLIGAVVVAVVGGLIVWMRHRQPKSVDARMASFRRGLNALAPESSAPESSKTGPAPRKRPEQFRIKPIAHRESDPGPEPATVPVEETGGDMTGGQPG